MPEKTLNELLVDVRAEAGERTYVDDEETLRVRLLARLLAKAVDEIKVLRAEVDILKVRP